MRNNAVEQLLARAVRAGLAPGAVAAWGRAGDEPRLAHVGAARLLPTPEPTGPDTWYDLASLTKPLVTGTLTVLAVRDGAIALDSTVGEVVREAAGRPIAAVTFRQLLCHSSGLPAWQPLYARASGPDRIVEAVVDLELERAPGSAVVYSCPGFVLLGAMLERVLGQRLDEAFERCVSGPLDLDGAVGFRPDSSRRRIAGAAAAGAVERRLCAELGLSAATMPAVAPDLPDDGNARFLAGVAGNAGLFGTAAGVFRLASQYLAAASPMLSPQEIAAVTDTVAGGGGPDEQLRCLAWQLAASPGCSAGPALGATAFGHTGFTGTSVWVDPERQAVFVLLLNRHHPNHHEVDLHPLRRRFHSIAMHEIGTS